MMIVWLKAHLIKTVNSLLIVDLMLFMLIEIH